MTAQIESAFDRAAEKYDHDFTHTTIGVMMRQAVWLRLDRTFQRNDHILELNCGTGEDAIYLARHGVQVLATDISPVMCQVAQQKVLQAGCSEDVTLQPLAIEDLSRLRAEKRASPARFDGLLSNFGGLNCVADLPKVARDLGGLLRQGARALFCVMGPLVPWEWGWWLFHGKPGKAFRRLQTGGTRWHSLTIRYPTIGRLRKAFAPHFALRRVTAIGSLLPPPYTNDWAVQHPRLLQSLNRLERRFETFPLLTHLADHYLAEFEYLGDCG